MAITERRFEVEWKNMAFFDEEVAKLDRWADDLKLGLELEIKEIDREIREVRSAVTLQDKLIRSVRLLRAILPK